MKIGNIFLLSLLALAPVTSGQRLLPFQGVIADSAGKPLQDGPIVVQFQIFDQANSGNLIWSGEQHLLTVNKGLVNTSLGVKNQIPLFRPNTQEIPFFESPVFLAITIDSNDDKVIDANDPPLLPRQVIHPPIEGRPVDRSNLVPVGGIVMWWGHPSTLPFGWEICDGQEVQTQGAKLHGKKPNLQDRFPFGASGNDTNTQEENIMGGANLVGPRSTGGTALTAAQMPRHTHNINDPGHTHNINDPGHTHTYVRTVGGNSFGDNSTDQRGETQNTGNSRTGITILSARTGISLGDAGESEAHDHLVPEHDNRPSFTAVHFIIRVK